MNSIGFEDFEKQASFGNSSRLRGWGLPELWRPVSGSSSERTLHGLQGKRLTRPQDIADGSGIPLRATTELPGL